MPVVNVNDRESFSSRQFVPQLLHSSKRMRVLLICFEPGQRVPTHPDRAETAFFVVEGRCTIVSGEEKHEVGAGSLVLVEAGALRGITSQDRSVVLAVNLI